MTTQTAPAPAPPQTNPADNTNHFWCCDPNTAFCGNDISDAHEVTDDTGHDCIVCLDLETQPCPHGCDLDD